MQVPGISPAQALACQKIFEGSEGASSRATFYRGIQKDQQPACSCFAELELPSAHGEPVVLLAAVLPKLLAFACSTCPAYATALHAGLREDPELQGLLYCDEVQGGNVLAINKSKKSSLFYLSFSQLRACNHLESVWLTVSAIQHDEADKVLGGLSTVTARLVRFLHAHAADINLPLHGARIHVRLRPRMYFLADGDAERAAFAVTGASGMKNCLRCCNVLKRGHGVQDPQFVDVAEPDASRFRPMTDHDYRQAADALRALHRPRDVSRFEKSSGMRRFEHGLLHDPAARQILPPSHAASDTMHVYFQNGIVSWELQHLRDALRAAVPEFSLPALAGAAARDGWTGPGVSRHHSAGYLRTLFQEKYFQDSGYKGKAEEQWAVVPLARYYVSRDLAARPLLLQKERLSLDALADVVQELRALRYRWMPVTAPEHVARLESLQEKHQKAFNAAYDGQLNGKPKHHMARHLGQSAVMLGFLPNCSTQESKHKLYKGGLTERLCRSLNKPGLFARQILTEMLLKGLSHLSKTELISWGLCAEHVKPAHERLKAALRCPDLRTAKAMRLWQSTVTVGDVLIFSSGRGGVVEQCLGSSGHLWALLRPMTPVPQGKHAWGSIWQLCDSYLCWEAAPTEHMLMPQWWRFEGQRVICLH